MPAWDISPSGVQAVMRRTQEVASEFEGQVSRAGTAMQEAAPASSSGIVAQALQGFAESVGADIEAVLGRTGAALSGCAQAVNAYVAGDLEMAGNAARAAATVPTPDLPGVGR